MDWIQLTQDVDQWWPTVNTEVKLHVSLKKDKFLD
jgi:hypothetical protein